MTATDLNPSPLHRGLFWLFVPRLGRPLLRISLLLWMSQPLWAGRIERETRKLDSLQVAIQQLDQEIRQLEQQDSRHLVQIDRLTQKISSEQVWLRDSRKLIEQLHRDIRLKQEQLSRDSLQAHFWQQAADSARQRNEQLRQVYAQLLRSLYMQPEIPPATFLLLAQTPGDLLDRSRYLTLIHQAVSIRHDQLASTRERLLLLTDSLQWVNRQLDQQSQELQSRLISRQSLISKRESTLADLTRSRGREEKVLTDIRSDADLFRRYRRERRLALAQVEKTIQHFQDARREMASLQAREKEVLASARQKLAHSPAPPADGTESIPSTSLVQGELPWPVQGSLVRRQGLSRDPVTGTTLENPGIDIKVQAGSSVIAVAAGRILDITRLPGFGNTLLLEHSADYISVYAGMERLDVTPGQTVQKGQQIGLSAGLLHFQLWQGRTNLDPQVWLSKTGGQHAGN